MPAPNDLPAGQPVGDSGDNRVEPLLPSVFPSERSPADAINQRIFETSLDLLLVVDRKGTFIRVSPSARTIIGYAPEELVGRSARDILYPADLDNTREEMRRARRGGEIRNFECRYRHKDGRVVPLVWTGVWSESEEQHFFIGRDISEREATERRLREAQRMDAIGQLTGGMAHDFNNLLGVIIGNLGLLRLNGRLSPEDDELVEEVVNAAVLSADLTRRLLAFARKQPLQPERVDVNALVGDIVGLLRRTLGEQVTITLDAGHGLWPVTVDPAQLEAALVNLATNARDAMPRGGRLIVTTANRQLDSDYAAGHTELAAGDYVLIEVTDNGSGIPPETMSRIFEPFFTTKEPGKGTGLGLAMVFGFMKQSGGHINVYSEPGVGTTFRLYLPRDRSGQAEPAPAAAATASGGDETVLVVEDNTAVRRIVRRQLTSLGYRVSEADTAAAALETLAREPIALLFSDIVMPGGMNGIELARIATARWPHLKVLLTSGFPEARMTAGGESLAGLRLLSKPYGLDQLARTLRDIIDRPGSRT